MRLNTERRNLTEPLFEGPVMAQAKRREAQEAFVVPVERLIPRPDIHMDRPERHQRRYRMENAYRRTERRLERDLARAEGDEASLKAATAIIGTLLAAGAGAIAIAVEAFSTLAANFGGYVATLLAIGTVYPPVGIALGAALFVVAAVSIGNENRILANGGAHLPGAKRYFA